VSEYQILELRRLADKSEGRREPRYDTVTGDRKLVNPDTPGEDHEPWPTLGITIINPDGPPEYTSIDTEYANQLVADGLLARQGERIAVRPAGPFNAPWSKQPHVFVHADSLVFKDHERGDVTYRVVRQPDKYVAAGYDNVVEDYSDLTADDLSNTVVQHFYSLQLMDSGAQA
jgi:hypothetical protein